MSVVLTWDNSTSPGCSNRLYSWTDSATNVFEVGQTNVVRVMQRADLRTFRTAHYLQEMVEMFRPVAAPETIGMPTLVVLSTGATFAALPEMQAIAGRFPRGEVRRIDCHHWPLTERPDEVRGVIEGWCATLP